MNNQSHHDSKHQPIAYQPNISHDTIDGKINPELLNYAIYRQPLWGIHTFVENVLKTDKPGFDIYTNKRGKTVIKELPLSAYYYLIHDYISRIPVSSDPVGYIGLFQECSIELGITNARPIAPGDVHLPGMNGAQLFNSFLALIRKKAKTIHKYVKTGEYLGTYDTRGLYEYIKYIDGLFVRYSKLLVIRVDLEYRDEYAASVTFEEAQDDISRFIKNRRWNSLFEHCVGYIISKEMGRQGRGFHFHCFVFFNGQKTERSMNYGKRIGKGYWENSITRLPDLNGQKRSRGAHFNCNIKENKYRYSGIGMIDHADELKRANLIYALVYLFKVDEQVLGEDAPPKTHTITRGVLPPLPEKRPGPARRVLICGEKVMVPKT